MTNQVEMSSEQGKQALDGLMEKMTPEQRAQLKASLDGDKPVHVHVDKDGKIVLGDAADEAAPTHDPAPEDPVEVHRGYPKKPSRIDQKRQQIFEDKVRRYMGKGMTQEQAVNAIRKEEYDAMPLEKKFANLEHVVSQSFRNLANDLIGLNQNNMAISDAFDINYRAIQKVFLKLGISNEEQQAFVEEAQKEVIEARRKDMQARREAQKDVLAAQQAAAEKAAVEAELSSPSKPLQETESEGSEIPKEATVFGG